MIYRIKCLPPLFKKKRIVYLIPFDQYRTENRTLLSYGTQLTFKVFKLLFFKEKCVIDFFLSILIFIRTWKTHILVRFSLSCNAAAVTKITD
jgi:hypothetical protein